MQKLRMQQLLSNNSDYYSEYKCKNLSFINNFKNTKRDYVLVKLTKQRIPAPHTCSTTGVIN